VRGSIEKGAERKNKSRERAKVNGERGRKIEKKREKERDREDHHGGNLC
jgi:hypothetical protein